MIGSEENKYLYNIPTPDDKVGVENIILRGTSSYSERYPDFLEPGTQVITPLCPQGKEPNEKYFENPEGVESVEESSANTSRKEIADISLQPAEDLFRDMTFSQLMKISQKPTQSRNTVQAVITASKMSLTQKATLMLTEATIALLGCSHEWSQTTAAKKNS
jgi:hypothetical protein